MGQLRNQFRQVRSTWAECCGCPTEADLLSGLTDTDRGFFRNRQKEVGETLLLTACWLRENGPEGSHDDAVDGKNARVGRILSEEVPRFDAWYFGDGTYSEYGYNGDGIHYEQVSNVRWRRFARTFEARLQNYVDRKERQRTPGPLRGGVVYVVGSTEEAPVCKIGMSTNLSSRLSGLQVGFPWELNVYRLFRGEAERFEYRVHTLLESEKIRGEWFRFSEKVRTLIEPRSPVPLSEFSVTKWFK